MAKRKIKALDFEIRLSDRQGEDFICVTDIAKFNSSEPGQVVRNYFRNKGNIDFLGAWEKLHNENFNYVEFDVIRTEVGSASFTMSAKGARVHVAATCECPNLQNLGLLNLELGDRVHVAQPIPEECRD